MNNEEKILEILAQMQGDISGLKTGQARMDQRLDKIEAGQAKLEADVTKIAITQENVVLPRLQLLAEGQVTLQEQIRRISVIDRLEDDVSTLKAAVKYLSSEVDQLKNAV